jgi:hypothetical protein
VSNPLRGIAHDSEYIANLLSQVPGLVLAVGTATDQIRHLLD